MRSAKDLRIIAIEGGDFTGKTTQAKLLAEKLDGLNIVIHFPIVNLNPNVKHVYNKTSNILYNVDFWLKEFKPLVDGEFINYEFVKESYAFQKILNVVCENVNINYDDKLLFIKDLHNLITKGIPIPYLASIAECIYENREIVPVNNYTGPNLIANTTDTNNYLNDCIGNKKVNIILDRFMISGYVYNKYIPIEFLHHVKNNLILKGAAMKEASRNQTMVVEMLFALLADTIKTHQIHGDNEITNALNLLFKSSNDHINWNSINKVHPNFYNIRLMNTNKELIKKLSGIASNDYSRKFDEYDKNSFIQNTANKLFADFNDSIRNKYTPKVMIETLDIGIEKYCTEDVKTNIENINKDIIAIVEKHENDYDTLCKNVSEALLHF